MKSLETHDREVIADEHWRLHHEGGRHLREDPATRI